MEQPSKRRRLSRTNGRPMARRRDASITYDFQITDHDGCEEVKASRKRDTVLNSYSPVDQPSVTDADAAMESAASVVQIIVDSGSSLTSKLTLQVAPAITSVPNYGPVTIPANPTILTVEATTTPSPSAQSASSLSAQSQTGSSTVAATGSSAGSLRSSSQVVLSSPPSTPLPSGSSMVLPSTTSTESSYFTSSAAALSAATASSHNSTSKSRILNA